MTQAIRFLESIPTKPLLIGAVASGLLECIFKNNAVRTPYFDPPNLLLSRWIDFPQTAIATLFVIKGLPLFPKNFALGMGFGAVQIPLKCLRDTNIIEHGFRLETKIVNILAAFQFARLNGGISFTNIWVYTTLIPLSLFLVSDMRDLYEFSRSHYSEYGEWFWYRHVKHQERQ